jgi:pimeloyl-ACP methyl ester carboxylesterase
MVDRILDLADGRRLGYSEWGPVDAPPIIYCHGFPSNRRELDLIQPALERRQVQARVVALNRPGYGPSTFQARRGILDWPRDVAEAADRLGIGRFAVLGVSGGCPYALACGYALGDRVTHIGVVVGMGPIEATGMKQATAISGPSAIGVIRRLQFGMAAFAFRKGQEDRFLEQSVASMGSADQEVMARPEVREWFTGVMRESFEQGGRAAAHEATLCRGRWGFDPQQVKAKTRLWYGGIDKTVPASAGRWLADRIPGSDYTLWPQHGHFSWMISDEAADVAAAAATGFGPEGLTPGTAEG